MRLKIVDAGPERERYVPLLLLADDSEQQVRGYMQKGTLFVAEDEDREVGIVLAIPVDSSDANNSEIELKAVAVEAASHNQGIGQRMLALVLPALEERGFTRVVLGTGNSGIGQIAFYQKAGFRMWKIERDVFSAERGYPPGLEENGIPLRDMIWLDREL
jgi:ribosomal protein S18 acetylase RimI-like enzyme